MPLVKHKLFQINIIESKGFDEKILKTLNDFLSESNCVYINHSICTLTEDVDNYGELKTVCTSIVISLVYKDLNETQYNLNKSSKKTKQLVHKEVKSDTAISEPNIETDLDKEIRELESQKRVFNIVGLETDQFVSDNVIHNISDFS